MAKKNETNEQTPANEQSAANEPAPAKAGGLVLVLTRGAQVHNTVMGAGQVVATVTPAEGVNLPWLAQAIDLGKARGVGPNDHLPAKGGEATQLVLGDDWPIGMTLQPKGTVLADLTLEAGVPLCWLGRAVLDGLAAVSE